MRSLFQKAVNFFGHGNSDAPIANPADVFKGHVPESVQSQLDTLDDMLVNTFNFDRLGKVESSGQNIAARWDAPGFGRAIGIQVHKCPDSDDINFMVWGEDDRSSRPMFYFHRVWIVETKDIGGVIGYLEDAKGSATFFDRRKPVWDMLQYDMLGQHGVKSERQDNFPKFLTPRSELGPG